MIYRKLMRFLHLLVWAAVFLSVGCAQSRHAAPPNILFIAIDDLRPELGCYGASHIKSPNIDALSARGVTFDRCYVQVAVCNPSRASMMTGLRPDTLGVYTLSQHFREYAPQAVTLPEHLRAHGYTCQAFGKIFHNPWQDPQSWSVPHQWAPGDYTHYSDEQQALRNRVAASLPAGNWLREGLRGMSTNAPDIADDAHPDGAMTTLAIDRLGELAKQDKPFFLGVGYVLPHLPWCPPKRYWDLYDRDSLSMPTVTSPPAGSPRYAIGTSYELSHYADMVGLPTPHEGTIDEAEVRRLRHGYFASVSFIDAQVGKLLQGLKDKGLADNTVVVLWSDHGYKLGDYNAWTKMTDYEIDTRIPMIVLDPRASANGRRTDRLVETLDLYPTLCELAGVPIPDAVEGKSFAPLLDDPSAPHKDAAYSQYIWAGKMGNSVRTDRWRYVEWRGLDDGKLAARELYDHEQDPLETRNVVDEHAQVAERLAGLVATNLETGRIDLRAPIRSEAGGERVAVRWVNRYPGVVRVTWVNPMGYRDHRFIELQAGTAGSSQTYTGHVFAVESLDGQYHTWVRVEAAGDIVLAAAPADADAQPGQAVEGLTK